MSLAARLIGAAVLPVAGWAAVSFAAPMSAWSGAGLFALAVAGGVIAARNPPPWSLTGAACCVLWVALPIAWWAPAWVPSAVAVWVYYAACLLWLVPFAWTVQWRRDPVEDGEPDEPGPRPVVVRGPGDGIDIGGGSDSFDYPDEDHIARTPPPGWTPRSMVTGGAPVVGVVLADDPPEAEVTEPFADLAGRVAAAWDGTKSVMHLDELAERMDRDKTLLRYDLDEAGVPVDPRAGKKVNGVKSVKAGVRWEAFEEWRKALTTS